MNRQPAEAPVTPLLSAEELRRLAGFLHQRTGMSYGESRRAYVERRVAERMQRCAVPSVAAYMALLRGSAAETEALVNSFTVNETYFYREEAQLACMSRSQRGAPVNSSPSHQTVPASRASRSVADIDGSMRR